MALLMSWLERRNHGERGTNSELASELNWKPFILSVPNPHDADAWLVECSWLPPAALSLKLSIRERSHRLHTFRLGPFQSRTPRSSNLPKAKIVDYTDAIPIRIQKLLFLLTILQLLASTIRSKNGMQHLVRRIALQWLRNCLDSVFQRRRRKKKLGDWFWTVTVGPRCSGKPRFLSWISYLSLSVGAWGAGESRCSVHFLALAAVSPLDHEFSSWAPRRKTSSEIFIFLPQGFTGGKVRSSVSRALWWGRMAPSLGCAPIYLFFVV